MPKKVYIFLFSTLFFAFSFLAVHNVANADKDTTVDNVPTNYVGTQQIMDIKTIIGKNTPNFISKPVVGLISILENFRINTALSIDKNTAELQAQIKAIDEAKVSKETQAKQSEFSKPFKYVKIFLLSIVATIFKIKLIFYGVVIVIFIMILRSIWRMFF